MIIDHIEVTISNYERSKVFYTKVLAPLNLELIAEIDGWAGIGRDDRAGFWFGTDDHIQPPTHIAFSAKTREQVDQFYEAAIQAGGICNGKPGLRPTYHANYYGTFILDLDGHNIEAVCHQKQSEDS